MKIFGKKDEGIFTTRMLTTITDIIVKKYIKAGYIAPENYEDTRQTIIEKYIAKREHIESLYDKRAKPETYLSAVLYKRMLEIMRSTSSKQKHFGEYEATVLKNGEGHQITPEEKLIIENEKKISRKSACFIRTRNLQSYSILQNVFQNKAYQTRIGGVSKTRGRQRYIKINVH